LENLLINTCPRRRITKRAIRDYHKRRTQKNSVFIQHCTYSSTQDNPENRRLLVDLVFAL
jgi:hypothetical protein